MKVKGLGRVTGATVWGIFSAGGGTKGLRLVIPALALLAVAALPLLFGMGTAQAEPRRLWAQPQQATTVDYDSDDDGLIEVDSLARLNAIRWDLNGDGKVATGDQVGYDAAFPNAAAGLGCGAMDHDGDANTPDRPVCKGYELTANLTFDEDGDGDVDSADATYWNGGAGWEPLGLVSPSSPNTPGLTATFEGNGNAIDYLFINRPEERHGIFAFGSIGLFRRIEGTGTVRNLSLTNVDVTGDTGIGALAGIIYGTVSGVSASGAVSGKTYIGGIAGMAGCGGCPDVHITNTSFDGTVTGGWYTGGLVGAQISSPIVSSHASGRVIGDLYVGGLVGYNNGSIERSYATGDVTGNTAGGLVGINYNGSIKHSYASGDVTGRAAGGLVGDNDGSIKHSYATGDVTGRSAGGLVGINYNGSIKHSYATGAVDGGDSAGGGLVGVNRSRGAITASYATGPVRAKLAGGFAGDNYGLIQDSYASGQVTGKQYAGGFIACNRSTVTSKPEVRRSYASGEVGLVARPRPGNLLGGFIAMNSPDATVTDSYWDTTVSRQATSAGGTGYTTAELQAPTGYTGIYAVWDVDLSVITGNNADTGKASLWDFGTARQYPALRADFDDDGTATACELGGQGRCPVASSATGAAGQRGADASNRAPVFREGKAALRQVMENTAAGTDIGAPVTATDPYGGNALVYSLGSTPDDAHFAIDSASGQLQVQGALDYEGTNTYTVTVTVSDGSLSDRITVTINVMDVLEEEGAPTARAVEDLASEAELEPAAEPAGTLRLDPGQDTGSAVTAEDGSMLIRWPAAAADADTYYRLRRKPDVDGSRTRVIVKVIRDGGERDVDERPGQVAYRDSDDALVAGQGYVYGVRTFYGDGSKSRWQRVGSEPPTDENEAPAYANASIALRVAENTAAGTNLGDPVAATDPDGDTLTYALGGTADDGHFAVDSATGQLSTKGALDYESDDSYSVTVTATDPDGLSASVTVSITVTDVNEAPAYADASIALRVAENMAAGTNIGDPVTATDPDGNTLTYALGSTDDDGHFAIDSATGQVSTKGALDYEADDSYSVTVTATDPDGQSASATVTIAVTDVNEAPAFADASIALRVAENTAAETNIGDPVTATDPDGDTLTYALGSTADEGHFAIDSATGQLSTKGALDYESAAAYTVTVTATDPDGLSASVTVSITVTDVADTPPGQPAPPTFTNIAETSFRILWTAPTPGSSPRDAVGLQYKLTTSSDEAWADVKPAPGTGRRGFNLKNRGGQHVTAGTSYDVRVREGNAQGWGPWSEAGTVTTAGTAQAQPGQPSAPTFTEVQERRFRILWQAPTPGASPITGYGLQYKLSSASAEAWADVKPAPSGVRVAGFNLTNRRGQSIAPGTSYDVRVRAKNDQGWGEWSETGTVTTAGAPPEGS